jgi:hypothetical protein
MSNADGVKRENLKDVRIRLSWWLVRPIATLDAVTKRVGKD